MRKLCYFVSAAAIATGVAAFAVPASAQHSMSAFGGKADTLSAVKSRERQR
jgi:hypothetical protein